METLFTGFIIQLLLSALLFAILIYFVIKNARLKKEIEQATSSSNNQEEN